MDRLYSQMYLVVLYQYRLYRLHINYASLHTQQVLLHHVLFAHDKDLSIQDVQESKSYRDYQPTKNNRLYSLWYEPYFYRQMISVQFLLLEHFYVV